MEATDQAGIHTEAGVDLCNVGRSLECTEFIRTPLTGEETTLIADLVQRGDKTALNIEVVFKVHVTPSRTGR